MNHTFVFNLLGLSIIQTVLHCVITVSRVERIFTSYLNKTEAHGHFVAAGFLGNAKSGVVSAKVACEQQNEKTRFVLHKGCSHQDSAGQAESGSLGPINHDLHSFIQHIQTQTHITLPACSADSSFLLLFNVWPYAWILVSLLRCRKTEMADTGAV